jgi:hypothetical protein
MILFAAMVVVLIACALIRYGGICSNAFTPIVKSESKFAIIMGISHYQHGEMSDLVFAHNDIEAWFRTLQNRQYSISVLSDTRQRSELAQHIGVDEREIHDATEQVVYRKIDEAVVAIQRLPPTVRATFVLTCSSHGEREVSPSGDVSTSIMAFDNDTEHTTFDNVIHEWELLSKLTPLLQNPNVDVIVVVDACFSGGFVRKLRESDHLGNVTVVSASTIDKPAFQVARLRHSALSWFLTQSLPTFQHRIKPAVAKANDDWRRFITTMSDASQEQVDAPSGLFEIYTKNNHISL